MQKLIIIAILGLSISLAGCTDKKIEPEVKPGAKGAEMKVHGETATKDSDLVGFKDVVKKQTLPTYPAVTVGKAFDDYSHVTKKEWRETQATNGTMYIDFSGWFKDNSIGIDAIKKGISQQGIEVKFVIKPDGTFYVAMASKLEATTDGKVSAYPLSDVKAVIDSIYANKMIRF